MKVNLDKNNKTNKIEYGDVIITKHSKYLIIDGCSLKQHGNINGEVLLLHLGVMAVAGDYQSLDKISEDVFEYGKLVIDNVVDVIKSDNVELRRV